MSKSKKHGPRSAGPSDPRRRGQAKTPKEKSAAKNLDLEKFKFGRLKVFHRALKQAKKFETAKILRRIRQEQQRTDAASKQNPQTEDKGHSKVTDNIGKLNLQLEACKQANLISMTNLLAEQIGWATRMPGEGDTTIPLSHHTLSKASKKKLKQQSPGASVPDSLQVDQAADGTQGVVCTGMATGDQPLSNGRKEGREDGQTESVGEQKVQGTCCGNTDADVMSPVNLAVGVVCARMLKAKCVQDEVEQALTSLDKKGPKKDGRGAPSVKPITQNSGHEPADSDPDASPSDKDEDNDGPKSHHPQLADSDDDSDAEPGTLPEAAAAVLHSGEPPTLLHNAKTKACTSKSDAHSPKLGVKAGDGVDGDGDALPALPEGERPSKRKRERDARKNKDPKPEIPAKRKGQRERRRLYEKMYGRSARHLLDGSGVSGENREYNKDARRVKAIERTSRSDSTKPRAARDKPALVRKGAGFTKGGGKDEQGTVIKKEEVDLASLHPSWQAKKLAKEQAAARQTALLANPVAKKMTFDSD